MLRYVTVVGALGAVVAPFLSGGAARSDAVDATVIGLAVGAVAVAALACARVRAARVVGVCGAVVVAVACGWLLVVDVGTGLAGPRVPVLAVGALAVAVGAAWSSSGRVTPVGVVAAVVAVGLAAVAPTAAEAVVVRSDARDTPAFEPAPLVEQPGAGQWAWQPPADVVDVVAAGHGVVVALGDGSLVGLDGTDGHSDWRYARRGARVGALVASVDRATVVATFSTGRDTRTQLLVAFDAATGRVRFERLVRGVLAELDDIVPGTRSLALRDDGRVTGYDLVTGERRWEWVPASGCTFLYTESVRGRSTVLAAEECPDRLSVVALDEVTGGRRWEHRVPLAGAGGERRDVHLRGTPDGPVVWLRVVTADVAPGAVTDGVFDAETGALLGRPGREWSVRTATGPRVLVEKQEGAAVTALAVFDPATGATSPLDHTACARKFADVTTGTAYVRACDDTGRDLVVVTQGVDGGPVTRTPVRLDGSGGVSEVHLVAAPGAVVVTRGSVGGTPAPVVGLAGR